MFGRCLHMQSCPLQATPAQLQVITDSFDVVGGNDGTSKQP